MELLPIDMPVDGLPDDVRFAFGTRNESKGPDVPMAVYQAGCYERNALSSIEIVS